MRIAIDARMVLPRVTGIGRYTLELIKALSKIDASSEYVILVNEDSKISQWLDVKRVKVVVSEARPLSLKEHIVIPRLLKEEKIEIFHATSYITPAWVPCKFVYSVLDLIQLRYPEYFPLAAAVYFRTVVKTALTRASKIVTISENTKTDINRYFHVPPAKIEVIHLGHFGENCAEQTPETALAVRKKYGINGKYVLYHGSKKRHKNISRLLEAFARVCSNRDIDHALVITGKNEGSSKETDFREIQRMVAGLGLQNRVIYTGYVEDADLPSLYRCAELFVFPSLYEGFGLPALEAMACECPVITSNSSSLPEICGDGAYYIDPNSVESIAGGIADVLADTGLRQTLVEKGVERAHQFTWEKCARKTLEVYRDVYNENSHRS